MSAPLIIERLTLVVPLGLRFWDAATRAFVGEGLRVIAYPEHNRSLQLQLLPNRSGVYVLHHAPGLLAFERPPERSSDSAPLAPRRFVLEVSDERRRYLPFTLEADLPHKGLWRPLCLPVLSPPRPGENAIPLYSLPGRVTPAGQVVLRAELWDATNNIPAAWAMVEARAGSAAPARGVADAQGRLTLILPYPEPRFSGLNSPPASTGRQLAQQSWRLQLQAFYSALPPTVARSPGPGPADDLPDLCQVVAQPPTTLWRNASRTRALDEALLRFGQELVVKSELPPEHTPQSVLLITPA